MTFKELMNFSIYEYDIQKFDNKWENVKNLLKRQNLDGLELLTNFEPVPAEIPGDLVSAVHLPSFMGWYRVWVDEKFTIPPDITDESVKYFYGGYDREEILNNFCDSLSYAAKLKPAYGVYHAAYTEVDYVFSKKQFYSDHDVLRANAELLNGVASAFPGGEPPFEIYIENLWYPGLKFLNSDTILDFMNMLDFSRWKLLLDTGHLMNAKGSCYNEEDAIDIVIECLNKLDDQVIEKIDGIHLHLSTSGEYQNNLKEPENYSEIKFDDKFPIIMNHIQNLDQHRPFSSEKCRDIVDLISPHYLTHELPAATAEEIERRICQQIGSLRDCSPTEVGGILGCYP